MATCEGGGIGRRVRLRGVWLSVWVQVPSFTPNKKDMLSAYPFCFSKSNKGLERVGIVKTLTTKGGHPPFATQA